LDSLSEADITDLCDVAAEWSAGAGDESMIETDPNASVDTDTDTPAIEPQPGDNPVNHSEDDETLEDEANESDDEQAQEADEGTENFEGLLSQVQSVASAAEGYADKFDELIDQAKASEDQGGDPESIEDLKDEAGDYIDEIESLMKEATAAAKDEDADGIAQAGLHIKEKLEILETLMAQAQVHAKTNQPAPPTPGSIPQATPALALWAKRYAAG
jgi:hypothetical protein